jgi:hypothetical protein
VIFVVFWLLCGVLTLIALFATLGNSGIDHFIEAEDKTVSKEWFCIAVVVLGPLPWFALSGRE